MSYKKTGIYTFGETVNKELQNWSAGIVVGVCDLIDEKAEKLKNLIQENAPVRYKKKINKRKKGKYKTSWKIKTTDDKFSRYEKTVYSSGNEYRLTHLLEKGHAKKGGGRVAPRVHIAPARNQIEKEYIADVQKLIKTVQSRGGGHLIYGNSKRYKK